MSFFVSSIVGGVNEQDSIVKNVHADDWIAELEIITRRGISRFVC